MFRSAVRFLFFANYFVGILAVALSLETVCQLQMPLNAIPFYVILFSATVFYYTYAYVRATLWGKKNPPKAYDPHDDSPNLRTIWYLRHRTYVLCSQLLLLLVCASIGGWMLIRYNQALLHLPLYDWLALVVMVIAALLYYGLMPYAPVKLNLRSTGWAKAFVIGFVWACTVNVLPLLDLKLEGWPQHADPVLVLWLFVKNWMFCTVNAIMFDLKDYGDDANHELKTFVVRFGLRKTIYVILMPLLVIGIISLIIFASIRHFPPIPVLINLIPFICLLVVAYSLHKRKSILFYLIVIDGLLLVKAVCGIIGMQFMNTHF
jgi:4-hydroxybenzoate polyprenyltransferase